MSENEIWQIVAALMPFTEENVEEEAAIEAILNGIDQNPDGLAFVYSNGLQSDIVRIEEMEGHFIIFINEEVAAQIEMPDESWEVTAGDIPDPRLLTEIIARIDASNG